MHPHQQKTHTHASTARPHLGHQSPLKASSATNNNNTNNDNAPSSSSPSPSSGALVVVPNKNNNSNTTVQKRSNHHQLVVATNTGSQTAREGIKNNGDVSSALTLPQINNGRLSNNNNNSNNTTTTTTSTSVTIASPPDAATRKRLTQDVTPSLSCWPARPTAARSVRDQQQKLSTTTGTSVSSSPTALLKKAKARKVVVMNKEGDTHDDDATLVVQQQQVQRQNENAKDNVNNDDDDNDDDEQAIAVGPLTLTSSKPALAVQLEKDLSVKLSSKKSLPEKVNIVSGLLKKFATMFPSYQSVIHATIQVVQGFGDELSKEVVTARNVAVASVKEFQKAEVKQVQKMLREESERRISLEAEVRTLKELLSTKVQDREHEVQIAHAETMRMIRRTQDEAHMEDEVRRLRLHVGQLAAECAKLKLQLHSYEYEKEKQNRKLGISPINDITSSIDNNSNNNNNNNSNSHKNVSIESRVHAARAMQEKLSPNFIEASRAELEKCRMVMQREIVDIASGTNSAFRLKIGHLQHEIEELQAQLKESQAQKEVAERLAYDRRFVRGTLPVEVFQALKRDSIARPDEALPRLRNEEGTKLSSSSNGTTTTITTTISPQEAMRRNELSSIGSCYTPRPFIPYDIQTVLGISLNERTRDIVEQLSVVAVDLQEELTEMRKNNRKLFAAARWMSSQELDKIFEEDVSDEAQNLGLAQLNQDHFRKSMASSQHQQQLSSSFKKKTPILPPSLMSKMSTSDNYKFTNNNHHQSGGDELFLASSSSTATTINTNTAASSSQPLSPTITTTTTASSGKIDGIIPTYRESEWPFIPHFLRTDITLGIVSKNWSSHETLLFSVQVLNLLPEAISRARRLKDKFVIKPAADVLTDRRRSALLPPLDATTASMIKNHQQQQQHVPIGYAVTVALRLLAEKQLIFEKEQLDEQQQNQKKQQQQQQQQQQAQQQEAQQQDHHRGSVVSATTIANDNFQRSRRASTVMLNGGGAAASSIASASASTIWSGQHHLENSFNQSQHQQQQQQQQQYRRTVNQAAVIQLATKYAYNWWESLHRYQEGEPLCRMTLKVLDGSQTLGTFHLFKTFVSELCQDLVSAAGDAAITASAASPLVNKNNNNNRRDGNNKRMENDGDDDDMNVDNNNNKNHKAVGEAHRFSFPAVTWPVFAKNLAWRFSGAPSENLSRKAVFAAAKTVDHLRLSFVDHLPIPLMLSMDALSPTSAATTTRKNMNDDDDDDDDDADADDQSAESAINNNNNRRPGVPLSPLVKCLLSITLDSVAELFDQVCAKLEPFVRQSRIVEGVSLLNIGRALSVAKELDSHFISARHNDFSQRAYESIAASSEVIRKRNLGKKEGVSFAEALEEDVTVNRTSSSPLQPGPTDDITLSSSSSSSSKATLCFSARLLVRDALRLCGKLDSSVHKPKKNNSRDGMNCHQSFNSSPSAVHQDASDSDNEYDDANHEANNNNKDNKSGSASGKRRMRKRSTTTNSTARRQSSPTGATLGDSIRERTNYQLNDSEMIEKSPTMMLNDILSEQQQQRSQQQQSSSTKVRRLSPKSSSSRRKKGGKSGNATGALSKEDHEMNVLLQGDFDANDRKNSNNRQIDEDDDDDDDDDGIFSNEQQQRHPSNVLVDTVASNEYERNERCAFSASTRDETAGDARALQALNEKDYVEWYDFVSKLRRVTPKNFSAEELQLHH